jgi:asparagine synthase (glutamine-hydrolysing)
MISDVPVGVFLSGGIDSSLVTAILQKNSNKSLQTFCIEFEDKSFNEGVIAQNISNILSTTHTSIVCNQQDFLNVISKLSDIYDEPFGDSSAIPTYLLSKHARENVKVALSGDGGDELFGGYAKYKFIYENSKYLKIPKFIRKNIMELSYLLKPELFEKLTSYIKCNSYTQLGSKYFKLRQTIGSTNVMDFFDKASSYMSNKELNKITSIQHQVSRYNFNADLNEKIISIFGLWDMQNFLPSDVLTKVDRASMSVALETREPFLDPEILEFSFSLPANLKVSKSGETKYLLKRLLSNYLPKEIIERPKYGFSIPINDWMQKNLKEEITHMMNENSFFEKFHLNQKEVSTICESFFNQSNRINPHSIWFIYCLYKWDQRWS